MDKQSIFNLAKRVRDKDTLLILAKLNQEEFSFDENDNIFWFDAQSHPGKSWLYIQNQNGTLKDVLLFEKLDKKFSPRRINIRKDLSNFNNKFIDENSSEEDIKEKPKNNKFVIKFVEKDGKKYRLKIPYDKFFELKKKDENKHTKTQ